jgi:hypothetical protein
MLKKLLAASASILILGLSATSSFAQFTPAWSNPNMYGWTFVATAPIAPGASGLLFAHGVGGCSNIYTTLEVIDCATGGVWTYSPANAGCGVGQTYISTADPIMFQDLTGDGFAELTFYERTLGSIAVTLRCFSPGAIAGIQVPTSPGSTLPLEVESPRPNPSDGTFRIPFQVSRNGELSAAVYDVQGRQVRELMRGPVIAGAHEAAWDGRDSGGRPAAAGTYFTRFVFDGRPVTEKAVVIR